MAKKEAIRDHGMLSLKGNIQQHPSFQGLRIIEEEG